MEFTSVPILHRCYSVSGLIAAVINITMNSTELCEYTRAILSVKFNDFIYQ